MKLAYLCADPGVPVYGTKGCSLHVQEIVRAFDRIGLTGTLFAQRVDGKAPADLEHIEVVELPALPAVGGPARERALQAANTGIARQVSGRGPFDIVYERYSLWSHAGLSAGKVAGAVTVLEVNAPLIEEQARFRELHDKKAALNTSLRAFAAADVIVAVSDGVARYLEQFAQARNKVHVIPNGVDTARFDHVPAQREERGEPFTVGFVGTLKPWHGVDILIEAFARLRAKIPECRLLLVGDGPERTSLAAQAYSLGVADAVEFAGAVPAAEIPALLARMDVGVAPYPELRDFYFSPLKVYEYMASALPVVASSIGQICDVIEDGQDGLLCRPGDADDIVDACTRLYHDDRLRNRLGLLARRKVLADHTWHSVGLHILNLASLPISGSEKVALQ
ncbi:MAG: glycosyltransferase family 4 protein [Gammaproteobacteria bacterium]|nr:glycosyltransferase family 4 protein [Gammaproteobacteria bacterium]